MRYVSFTLSTVFIRTRRRKLFSIIVRPFVFGSNVGNRGIKIQIAFPFKCTYTIHTCTRMSTCMVILQINEPIKLCMQEVFNYIFIANCFEAKMKTKRTTKIMVRISLTKTLVCA